MECWSMDGVWKLRFGDLVGDEKVRKFRWCVGGAAIALVEKNQ